jgi:MFS family permease
MSNRSWLFVLSCIALVTSAFTFSIRGEILQEMGTHFGFLQEYNGQIDGARFWGMAASLLLGGFICDIIGMKRVLWLAFFSHIVGTLGMVYAPRFEDPMQSLWWLQSFSFIMGCGNGFTETAINPLIATLYLREKTHYLNILHAWWPGGMIIGGLLALAAGKGIDLELGFAHLVVPGYGLVWSQILMLILIPAGIYGLMLLVAKFPETERVASGVSNQSMFLEVLRPLFLIWAVCMLLTASTELGPQNWQASVMEKTANLNGTQILIYTSGMMFFLRHFAGPIAHQISPIGLLGVSAALSAVGLYLLSFAHDTATAFGYATIFGLGIAYFWPTMLGVASERFPKGGAMILCLLGVVGNSSIAVTIPMMGGIVDRSSVTDLKSQAEEANISPAVYELVLGADGKGISTEAMKWLALRTKDPEALSTDDNLLSNAQKERRAAISALSDESAKGLYTIADAAQQVGFREAFRTVAILPTILVVIFGAIWIYDWSRGGYKPEVLLSEKEEEELLGGGAEGPIS